MGPSKHVILAASLMACITSRVMGDVATRPHYDNAFVGDVTLVNELVAANRANRAGLVTWQGTAAIQTTTRTEAGILTTDSSVDFAEDIASGQTRWNWTDARQRSHTDGQTDATGTESLFQSGMRKKGLSYTLGPFHTGKLETHNLIVAPARGVPNLYGEEFDPALFLTEHGSDLTAWLEAQATKAGRPGVVQTVVTRDGPAVIVDVPGSNSTDYRLEFDLSKGGSLVRIYNKGPSSTEDWHFSITKVGEVWVPSKVSISHQTNAGFAPNDFSRTIDFAVNRVNEPLPSGSFSFEAMGVKAGDLVHDNTMGLRYEYQTEASVGIALPANLGSEVPESTSSTPGAARSAEATNRPATFGHLPEAASSGRPNWWWVGISAALVVVVAAGWMWPRRHARQ
jgi:hypothetical protein